MRQLTTWQVLCQVERRFRSRKSNRQPLPWDVGISPPSSNNFGLSHIVFAICHYINPLHYKVFSYNINIFLEPVYTMDHEVGRWKMASLPFNLLKIPIHKAFGPLTRCKPKMDQEEWPCTKKTNVLIFFWYMPKKGSFEKIK